LNRKRDDRHRVDCRVPSAGVIVRRRALTWMRGVRLSKPTSEGEQAMPTPVLRDAAARVPRAANGTPPDEASGVTETFTARRHFSIPEAPP